MSGGVFAVFVLVGFGDLVSDLVQLFGKVGFGWPFGFDLDSLSWSTVLEFLGADGGEEESKSPQEFHGVWLVWFVLRLTEESGAECAGFIGAIE